MKNKKLYTDGMNASESAVYEYLNYTEVENKEVKKAKKVKKTSTKRLSFIHENNLIVFRYGKTSNKKIASKNENIVQTYTFSIDQYNYIENCVLVGEKPTLSQFFSHDNSNCGDCPLSKNQGYKFGKCYTHKLFQYSGFISMLKSIVNEFNGISNVPTYEDIKGHEFFTNKVVNRYVRFGSYGEPTKIPYELIVSMTEIAKSYSGYTHQYIDNEEYLNYFMASTHGKNSTDYVRNHLGGRSFVAVETLKAVKGVECPTMYENGVTCSSCGLCSGILGKGNKDIKILKH